MRCASRKNQETGPIRLNRARPRHLHFGSETEHGLFDTMAADAPRIGVGLLAQPSIVGSASTQQQKPNILFILADNTGYGDLGVYGGGELRGAPTPRIDQLAADGLRLTQFLVEPACTPSRAAFMTARYSIRSGLSHILAIRRRPEGREERLVHRADAPRAEDDREQVRDAGQEAGHDVAPAGALALPTTATSATAGCSKVRQRLSTHAIRARSTSSQRCRSERQDSAFHSARRGVKSNATTVIARRNSSGSQLLPIS